MMQHSLAVHGRAERSANFEFEYALDDSEDFPNFGGTTTFEVEGNAA